MLGGSYLRRYHELFRLNFNPKLTKFAQFCLQIQHFAKKEQNHQIGNKKGTYRHKSAHIEKVAKSRYPTKAKCLLARVLRLVASERTSQSYVNPDLAAGSQLILHSAGAPMHSPGRVRSEFDHLGGKI